MSWFDWVAIGSGILLVALFMHAVTVVARFRRYE
jgi:hypothetical protein